MKAGLEVHQQLSTGKLFCDCPAELSETVLGEVRRRLRATGGENHAVDAAAAFQAARGLRFRYEPSGTSCLVELDEEPPHALDPKAVDVALTMAMLLGARPLDEIVVMRKIVVDGSNTSGFQRTALVAVDGTLEVEGKVYSIPSICLEEDAARKVGEEGDELTYRLDRLGIPLVEIATGPEITSGTEARRVAEEIGALLRATRRVRRGIGTIREDLNVSTSGGARVEIKGVQELRLMSRYAEGEEHRQRYLLRIRDALRSRGAKVPESKPMELTHLVERDGPGPVSASIRRGGRLLALPLPGFAGLLRSPEGEPERLGRELADRARTTGLGGLLHSDELPGHGIDEATVARIRSELKLGPTDGFILIASEDPARAELAVARIRERAREAIEGVPSETRDPLLDGRTRYSRPLPGRDRMYPETDVPPVPVPPERLARIARSLPERPPETRARLAREHGLGEEVLGQLIRSGHLDTFEILAKRGRTPALAARVLTQDVPSALAKRPAGADEEAISLERLDELLRAVEGGAFAKEGIPAVLDAFLAGAETLDSARAAAGLEATGATDLAALADSVVQENEALVRERGAEAFSPLMGDLMRKVRGKADGKDVSRTLREALDRRLRATPPT